MKGGRKIGLWGDRIKKYMKKLKKKRAKKRKSKRTVKMARKFRKRTRRKRGGACSKDDIEKKCKFMAGDDWETGAYYPKCVKTDMERCEKRERERDDDDAFERKPNEVRNVKRRAQRLKMKKKREAYDKLSADEKSALIDKGKKSKCTVKCETVCPGSNKPTEEDKAELKKLLDEANKIGGRRRRRKSRGKRRKSTKKKRKRRRKSTKKKRRRRSRRN